VGAADADVAGAVLVEDAAADELAVVDDGDAVCELLLHAGTNTLSAATPTVAIIGLFIRVILTPHSLAFCDLVGRFCDLIGKGHASGTLAQPQSRRAGSLASTRLEGSLPESLPSSRLACNYQPIHSYRSAKEAIWLAQSFGRYSRRALLQFWRPALAPAPFR
jgi:hypothetical protein